MSRKAIDSNKILLKAVEIADLEGVEALSLASLAKGLGIKPPSLYNHIESLSALRQQMALYGTDQLGEALRAAFAETEDDQTVMAVSKAYVNFVRSHPGLYEALSMAPDATDPAFQEAGRRVVDLVVEVLDVYNLEPSMQVHLVRGLRSMLHGFASIEQKKGFGMPEQPDESLQIMVGTFLAGIKASQGLSDCGTLGKKE